MLVFEYELLLIQPIGTTVSVAMETMNICIIQLHFCRVNGFSLSFLHLGGPSYYYASVMFFRKYVTKV